MTKKANKKVANKALAKTKVHAGKSVKPKSQKTVKTQPQQRKTASDAAAQKKTKRSTNTSSKSYDNGGIIVSSASLKNKKKGGAFDITNIIDEEAQATEETFLLEEFDLLAHRTLDDLQEGHREFTDLTRNEKNILFRFFYKYIPVIGRILDLHTNLPLSKLRLQAPKNTSELASDYILNFYARIFERVNFEEFTRDLVLIHLIYGVGRGIVDDYYTGDSELQDPQALSQHIKDLSEEDQKFISDMEEKYVTAPTSVSVEKRMDYLDKKFKNFESSYQGPSGMKIVHFYEIDELLQNKDINYEAIRYIFSESLDSIIEENPITDDDDESPKNLRKKLEELGYSPGFIKLIITQLTTTNPDLHSDGESLLIDNDHSSGNVYFLKLARFEDESILTRVIDSALEYISSKRSIRAKVKQIGKTGRVISAPGATMNQLLDLEAEMSILEEDPSHQVLVNFEVSFEDITPDLKQDLQDMIDSSDKVVTEIGIGTGAPDSLITGDTTFSGDSIKFDVLNTEYLHFKQNLIKVFEDSFLKPIALRKGLLQLDEWGNTVLVYPKVTFSRISLRNEDSYDILFNLYQKGSLPLSIILDVLNLDETDVTRALKQDVFTMRDSNFNDMKSDMYRNLADELTDELLPTLKIRLKETLGLKSEEENTDQQT